MVTGTTTMLKVTQVATGVAGSPYYLSAYFDASLSTSAACAAAWRVLLAPTSTQYIAPYQFLPITEVQLVDPATGDLIGTEPVSIGNLTFIGTGDPLPPATSLLLRWRSGQYIGGREIRGRTNVARMAEVDSSVGAPTSGLISAWQTRLDAFLATTNVRHVTYSPKNGNWAHTVSANPWGQWAVLRSRRD
jgi:hypothetical protein